MELALPLIAFLVAVVLRLWRRTRSFLWPLNLFAVFIHELSHGIAAILTGGTFERFEMYTRGGLAYTRGGKRGIILSAGYVGTAIFGAVLLFLTNTLDYPEHIALGLGVFFALVTVLFSGIHPRKLNVLELLVSVVVFGIAGYLLMNADSTLTRGIATGLGGIGILLLVRFISDEYFFAVAVGMLSSGVLLLIGYYAQPDLVRFVLNFIAFLVGLNTIYDSWYLFALIQEPRHLNDATSMAHEVGGSAQAWAIIWVVNAVALLTGAVILTFVLNL